MSRPLRIQVAVQGGGAKIAALLAAAEALWELEQDGQIEITRLAGTSAGAVVACLLARGRNHSIADVKARLIERGQPYIDRLFPPKWMSWALVKAAATGKPIYDPERLRCLLGEFLTDKGYKTFAELHKPVVVLAADIRNNLRVVHRDGEKPVLDALVDSCALPFVFRNWKTLGDPPIVDGGICENLPSDLLVEDTQAYGKVVALSFQESGDPPKPKGLLEFAFRLLETAISNSMARARRGLPRDAVISLQTELGTFDFRRLIETGLKGEEYGKNKERVNVWLSSLLQLNKAPTDNIILGDPWHQESNSPEQLEQMVSLHKIYLAQHDETPIRLGRSTMLVTAFCLLDDVDPRRNSPDLVRQIVQLGPVEQPIYCYRIGLGPTPAARFVGRSSWSARNLSGRALRLSGIPVSESKLESAQSSDAHPLKRYVLLFFEPQLPVGDTDSEPYEVEMQTLVESCMKPLATGADFLSIRNTRPADFIERVDLVLYLPQSFPDVEMSAPASGPEGRPMTDLERSEYGPPPPGFRSLGWTVSQVPPGISARVQFSCPGFPVQGGT